MFKKKDIFFKTFEEMADALVEAVEYFAKGVSDLSDVTAFAKKMKEYESKCDQYVHTILKELNKTFITPIEREDIMALTSSLDDVIDVINRKRIPQIQKDKLIKKARSTPSSGLSSFLRTVK